jgi:hypothetical protein
MSEWLIAPPTNPLAAVLWSVADEIEDPYICRSPAYGVPGHAHCAACCYGTGVIVTCREDEIDVDRAIALRRVARWIEHGLFAPRPHSHKENP